MMVRLRMERMHADDPVPWSALHAMIERKRKRGRGRLRRKRDNVYEDTAAILALTLRGTLDCKK